MKYAVSMDFIIEVNGELSTGEAIAITSDHLEILLHDHRQKHPAVNGGYIQVKHLSDNASVFEFQEKITDHIEDVIEKSEAEELTIEDQNDASTKPIH
jgi:hypothetical protein